MTNAPAPPDDGLTTEEIANKLRPYLRPEKQQQGVQVVATMVQKYHSGPLPPPEDLAEYERTLPGGAERIFQMTEREQAHRHTQESRIITHEYVGRYIGQAGAMVALLATLGVVAYCATIGQPIAAAVLGAVGAIVVAFLKYSAMNLDHPEEPAKPPAKQKQSPQRRKR